MTIGAQVPQYNVNGLITSYNNGTNYTQDTAKTTGAGRYVNGVWVPNGSASPVPAPLGSNLSAPTVAGYNGSNPTNPSSPLPSYSISSLAKTIPGINSTITGSQFSSPSAGPTATAQLPSVPTLPNYAPPTDPAIDALNQKSFSTIGQEFSGQLPTDVQQQIQQRSAERGISTGVNSPNTGAAYLRALGLTSLDMTDRAQKAFQPIQLATISENGDNFRAILGAKSALDQLNVSQAGETNRFNAGAQNDLNKQILSGKQALQELAAKGHQDIALALINATAQQQDTILKGAQAMQQLQASESGQGERLDAQLAAQLQSQVLAGQQELSKINASGANERANTVLQGQNSLDQIIEQYSLKNQSDKNDAADYNAGFNAPVNPAGGSLNQYGQTVQNQNAGFDD